MIFLVFSVPVEYIDNLNLSLQDATDKAVEYAKSIKTATLSIMKKTKCPPVYWIFDLIVNDNWQDVAGGIVMVDRIDGHIWSQTESEEYMYDFNNIF